jgi:hypothetical protein
MLNFKSIKILLTLLFVFVFLFSCTAKKSIKYLQKPISSNSKIGVIIDAPNNLKNVVLMKFLKKGYNVKAINASDLYLMSDIFDITDLKKLSYNSGNSDSLVSMEKTYNGIYKMHVYNFELNKVEILNDIKKKWGIDYLILFDLKNWEKVSWGRAIDLNSYEIVWLENYPVAYTDNLETVLDHFIESINKK